MKDVDIMKACQKGFGNYKGALQDANNLLAECYGAIGRLREDLERCSHQASFCIGNEEGLKQQLEKVREITVSGRKHNAHVQPRQLGAN